MAKDPSGKRHRVLVPFEVGSFLRAPYGWTMRMRREERPAGAGTAQPTRLGWRVSLLIAFLVYGPWVLGGVVGWTTWGGWSGLGLGVVIALVVQFSLMLAFGPVLAVVWGRRSDGVGDR